MFYFHKWEERYEEDPHLWIEKYVEAVKEGIPELIASDDIDEAYYYQEICFVRVEKLYKRNKAQYTSLFLDVVTWWLPTLKDKNDWELIIGLGTEIINRLKTAASKEPDLWLLKYLELLETLELAYAKEHMVDDKNKISLKREKVLGDLYKNDAEVWAEKYIDVYETSCDKKCSLARVKKYIAISEYLFEKNKKRWKKSYLSALSFLMWIYNTDQNNAKIFAFAEKYTFLFEQDFKENESTKKSHDIYNTYMVLLSLATSASRKLGKNKKTLFYAKKNLTVRQQEAEKGTFSSCDRSLIVAYNMFSSACYEMELYDEEIKTRENLVKYIEICSDTDSHWYLQALKSLQEAYNKHGSIEKAQAVQLKLDSATNSI